MRLKDITPGEVLCATRNGRYTIWMNPCIVLEPVLNERRKVPCALQGWDDNWFPVWLTLTQISPMSPTKQEHIDAHFNRRKSAERQSDLREAAKRDFVRKMKHRYNIDIDQDNLYADVVSSQHCGSEEVKINVNLSGDEFIKVIDKARQGMMFPAHQEVSL